MPHIQFPCQYLYWTQVENHLEIKEKYKSVLAKIKKESIGIKPFRRANFVTNFSTDVDSTEKYEFLDDEDIENIVWKPIKSMLSELEGRMDKPKEMILQDYWANFYDKGQYQEMHNHVGDPVKLGDDMFYPTFSVVYILNDEGKNSLSYDLNQLNVPFANPYKQFIFDTSIREDIKEGTVLVFSSTLKHAVNPVETDNRITLAFNVSCSF